MATIQINAAVAAVVSSIIGATDSKIKADTLGGKLAASMAELFVMASESDATFAEVFGNGEKGKAHTGGILRDQVEAGIVKMAPQKKTAVRAMLSARLSEARRLRRLEGFPQDGETVQAAVKRYTKPVERGARTEGNETAHFVIPPELTVENMAEAFSVWMCQQSAAKINAVASELKSMLTPAKVKAAAQKSA